MITYGFYNSKNHDRKYDAIQMSSIFDGIIQDGVYMAIGNHFNVLANSDMTILVDTGRAWFHHTWTLNDSLLPLEVPLSEVILNRIDAVVLEINSEESVRANSVKIVKGSPSSNPSRPTMINTKTIHQYPLAFIKVNAGVTSIRQADITNMVGTSSTPFVTGVLQSMNIDTLIAQWEDQWNAYFLKQTSDMEQTNEFWKNQWRTWFQAQTTEIQEAYLNWENQWNQWYQSQTSDMKETNQYWKDLWQAWFYDYVNNSTKEYTDWKNSINEDFRDWWESLKGLLVGNPDANFAMELLDLEKRVESLENFMNNLSVDHSINDDLLDSSEEAIRDSDGSVIECRKVVFLVEKPIGLSLDATNLIDTVIELGKKLEALETFKKNLTRELTIYDDLIDSGAWLFVDNDNASLTEKILDNNGNAIESRVILVVK